MRMFAVPIGFRAHAHVSVTVTEIGGIVFFESNPGSKFHVFGFMGNAKPATSDHALNAVTAVKNGILG
jgi:hypothetical protein